MTNRPGEWEGSNAAARDRLITVAILGFWFALPWIVEAMLGALFGMRIPPWGPTDHVLPLLMVVGSYRAGGSWPGPLGHMLYGGLGGTIFVLLGIEFGPGVFYGPLLPGGTASILPLALNAAGYTVLLGLMCRWAARLGAAGEPNKS